MIKPLSFLFLFLFCSSLQAQVTMPAPDTTADTNSLSPIMIGTTLRTEWRSVRNPFKADVRAHVETVERIEQFKVIGVSHMPDEKGIMRSYAFLAKVSDSNDEAVKKDKTVDTITLQAFPEILDESTQPAIEDVENCSFRLGNDTLWFLGCYATSNKTVAVFWPMGSYPAKEESLKTYDVVDNLDSLHIRKTLRGEKIATSIPLSLVPSARKGAEESPKTDNSKNPGSERPAIIGKLPDNPNVPPAKARPITGDLLIDVDRALHAHDVEFSTNNTSVKPYY